MFSQRPNFLPPRFPLSSSERIFTFLPVKNSRICDFLSRSRFSSPFHPGTKYRKVVVDVNDALVVVEDVMQGWGEEGKGEGRQERGSVCSGCCKKPGHDLCKGGGGGGGRGGEGRGRKNGTEGGEIQSLHCSNATVVPPTTTFLIQKGPRPCAPVKIKYTQSTNVALKTAWRVVTRGREWEREALCYQLPSFFQNVISTVSKKARHAKCLVLLRLPVFPKIAANKPHHTTVMS